jgi:hypothetical protein
MHCSWQYADVIVTVCHTFNSILVRNKGMWFVINLTLITGQVTVGKLGNTVTAEQVCRLGFEPAFNFSLKEW